MEGVVEPREENRDEGREELRRLNGRFVVAVLLELSTRVCKRAAAGSDPNPTMTGHVAYSWAIEFNLWAHLAFTLVILKIIVAPMVVELERLRKVREECDVQLLVDYEIAMDDEDGGRERREETRRVNDRFFLAVSLAIFTGICKRASGFDGSYLTETTKNGHVALYCASELNKMADMCFMVVIIRIGLSMLGLTFAPVVMRRLREETDMKLTLGSICLAISLCFSAYLRFFVVG
ncbi:hypothetical protein AXX17_AT1G23010 [Arabidopsis thaliana]|uniref:Transmembrane protein n=2 Tax=Arabidopsis TaxID=3701 RepID=A0A178WFZ2_ARATH|nr:hypothetical protein AXX17_AT1G23010 [Arabidopsis thaliana]